MTSAVVFSACTQQTTTPPVADTSAPVTTTATATPTEFRIGYQVSPNAELLTKNLGLIEAKYPDVDIKWLSFDSGRDVNTAMASGGIDVGLVGSVPVSTGIAQNLSYQVYFIHGVIGDNEALAVTKSSGIASMADLTGKKVAVPFGSTTHFSFLSALKQEGIDPNDLTILDMQPQDMLAAWQRGDIDGGFVWYPILGKMLEADGDLLVTAKQLAEKGIITADLGVVSKDFAAKYPDFLAGYVSALSEAVQLYRDDPKAASEALSAEIGLSPEETLKVMDQLVWLNAGEQASPQYLGVPDAPGALSQVLKDSAEFMVEQGDISAAPDLDAYKASLFNRAVADAKY
ncbi:MAG: ABC transporter substrate-binding protein [Leptolyngbyaceae cyanobacterium MO_188.B28]|nr:ABC transporter substrate-binding protein [Leptolyngbyaceae cyanobacterium MO_188.B28]